MLRPSCQCSKSWLMESRKQYLFWNQRFLLLWMRWESLTLRWKEVSYHYRSRSYVLLQRRFKGRGPRQDSTPADIAFFTYVPKATRSSTVIFRAVDYNFIGLHETSVGNVSDEKPKLASQRDNPCGLGPQNTKHAFIIGTVHPTRCTALESLGGFYSSHGWVPPQLSQIYKQVHQATSRDANTCHSSERCIFWRLW